jgi:cytochrome P450
LTDFETVDFFTDESLVPDPYPYFDHLRSKCPVVQATPFNVLAVTGYDEALTVYKDPAFSSCVSVAGPFSGMPFGPGGHDDVSELIEQHRATVPMAEHITSQDPPLHTRTRGLMNKLITPKRLKENEEFMWRLADQQLDTFIERGKCEFLADYAKPFSLLVIADLLGVPAEDHDEFRAVFAGQIVGEVGKDAPTSHNPLQWLNDKFSAYIQDRRNEPRDDVLTGLAQAKYEDGSTPEIEDVTNLSTFLFAAGTETTTKLVSSAMRIIGDSQEFEKALPDGPHHDHRRRREGGRGHDGHGAAWRVQSRRAEVRRPQHLQPGPAQCARTDRVHPWCAFLPGRSAGAGRGPDLAEQDSRSDVRHCGVRGSSRPGRRTPLRI